MSVLPAQTDRAHLLQRDPRCDTVVVLNMAARRFHISKRWADMNACAADESDYNLHWPEGMLMNQFTHIIDAISGKLRPVTHHEGHTPVILIPDEQMLRYRKKVGNKWVRPFKVIERNKQAKWRRVKIAWETKSPAYDKPHIAQRIVDACEGFNVAFMTLVTMGYWRGKMEQLHKAGGRTALLAHGARRPEDLDKYMPFIDAIWGHWN